MYSAHATTNNRATEVTDTTGVYSCLRWWTASCIEYQQTLVAPQRPEPSVQVIEGEVLPVPQLQGCGFARRNGAADEEEEELALGLAAFKRV